MSTISFHTDHDLRISSWDDDIVRYTGKNPETTLGNKYYFIIPQISVKGKDAVSEVIRSNKPITLKGHPIPCLFSQITADIDIRPKKVAEGRVEEVEVSLLPSSRCSVAHKLNQSQKLINIGKIASTLAHGVRNPLNAIKGAVVYLSEKYSEEAPLVEFTRIMEQEISRLEHFISQFLSSSVSETDIRESDINSLLKKIEIFTSLQIYTKNIRSFFEYGDIPPITFNPFHLEQAILNVINNAIEAMSGGGQLKISSSTETRNGSSFVVIAVSDSGQGMTDTVLGEMPADKRDSGRGFGLFITYEILKHFNGHLEIDSQLNRGTTIRLFIPCQTIN